MRYRWTKLVFGMSWAEFISRLRAAVIVGAMALPSIFPKPYQTRLLKDEYGAVDHEAEDEQ